MFRYIIVVLMSLCMPVFFSHAVSAAGLVTDSSMQTAAFWQKQIPDKDIPILDDAAKNAFNKSIIVNSSAMTDMAAYPLIQSGDSVKNLILSTSLIPDEVYDESGNYLSAETRDALVKQMNLDSIGTSTTVQMGVTVRRSNIRTLPTGNAFFGQPYASQFDVFQETAIDPSEAVLILQTSADGQYFYICMYNYSGWVAVNDIALTDNRKTWLKYVRPQDFLVVTDKAYQIGYKGEQIFYQMGSRLPIEAKTDEGYAVTLPQRDAEGKLQEVTVPLVKSDNLHEGYLPYTRGNILGQAFRFLGEPYGWGGLINSVDCSSFIADIYRSMGIFLPRNADQQEMAGGIRVPFTDFTEDMINDSIITNCHPGDVLFMDGHVMLYIGQINNIPYIIHALGSYTDHTSYESVKHKIMRVVVSDLSLTRYNGETFAAALTSTVSFH